TKSALWQGDRKAARVPARGTPTILRMGLPRRRRARAVLALPWLCRRFASASHAPTESKGSPAPTVRVFRPEGRGLSGNIYPGKRKHYHGRSTAGSIISTALRDSQRREERERHFWRR